MEHNWLEQLQTKNQLAKVMETNQYTEKFGLALTPEEASLILEKRNSVLREQQRVEFGESILPKIIFEFCDSDYIDRKNYAETISRLQEIFYLYKNETEDEITDEELLHVMKEQFEKLCFGDLDYLENTCLAEFAAAIRAGYRELKYADEFTDCSAFDKASRFSHELYEEALRGLMGGE